MKLVQNALQSLSFIHKVPQIPRKTGDPTSSEKEDAVYYQCGIGLCRPQWLRKAANPKPFLFFYSILGFLSGAQYPYLIGCMTTLERRFAYRTEVSGFINMTNEIGPIILCLFVGYFGGKSNRPKLLAFGSMLGSLSCLIFTVPHFLYGVTHFGDTINGGVRVQKENHCRSSEFNMTEEECESQPEVHAVSFFLLGSFVKGISTIIFYTVGPSYMDDGVKKKNSSIYLGMLFAVSLLGPVSGFLLSSLCLQFYEDPFTNPGFSEEDSRWIGAWWVGFIILGSAIFIFSIPMLLFPRQLPSKRQRGSSKKQEDEEEKGSAVQQLKDMGRAIRRLGKNPLLMCHYLRGVLRLNGTLGYYMLLPKYMEMQFRQSASKASLYSAPASIIAMQFGIILGGISIRKWKPGPRVLTGSIALAEVFNFTTLMICMFITCPIVQMAGFPNAKYEQKVNVLNECNSDCMCDLKTYTPVCGPDGKSTYFSPCLAGCTGYAQTSDKQIFTNCSCLYDNSGHFTTGSTQEGFCGSECNWMFWYIIILSLGKLVSSTTSVADSMVVFRCVDPEDKSMALGASGGIYSLFAFIPFPLIYGALTDASCLIWEDSCGKQGNCWVYDSERFRYLLHGVSTSFIFLACICDVLVCILSPRLKNLYDEDDYDKKDSTY